MRRIFEVTPVFALLVFGIGCGSLAPSGYRERPLAIVDVALISMTGAVSVSEKQTVIVRGDLIESAGPSSGVRIPRDAVRIDGRGKYLMPGLVDAHVHLEHFESTEVLRVLLAHGVTTVRNMDGRPEVLDWRRRTRAGEIAGPVIVTAGPILDGDPPLLPDNTRVGTPEAARAAVAAQADEGYDFVKVYTNLTAEAYAAVVDEARERALPVTGHVPRAVPLTEAAGRQISIEHLSDIGREIEAESSPYRGRWHWSKLLVAPPVDPEKLERSVAALALAKIAVVPTLVQAERSVARPDELGRWLEDPRLRLLPAGFVDEWTRRLERDSGRMGADDWRLVEEGRKNRSRIVMALHRANVPLLVGTDMPNPFVIPGASVHEEIRSLVDAGLEPAQALIAATRAPCEFMRLNCGTVESGKRADLILLDGDPLGDLRFLQPLLVIAGGRLIDPVAIRDGMTR
jgi:imidazolonepropionase-like amidohydrolase